MAKREPAPPPDKLHETMYDDAAFSERQRQIDEANWAGSGLAPKPGAGHEPVSEG